MVNNKNFVVPEYNKYFADTAAVHNINKVTTNALFQQQSCFIEK
jgi:hypothetical protein